MRPPGSFRIQRTPRAARRLPSPTPPSLDAMMDVLPFPGPRCQRIVDSLRAEILECGREQVLRVRRVFAEPYEVFRLEIEVPSLHYRRTTLLDRDSLEELLATEGVRHLVLPAPA